MRGESCLLSHLATYADVAPSPPVANPKSARTPAPPKISLSRRAHPLPAPSWIACRYRCQAGAIWMLLLRSRWQLRNQLVLLRRRRYHFPVASIQYQRLRGLRAAIDAKQERSGCCSFAPGGNSEISSYSCAAEDITFPSRASNTSAFVDCVPLSMPSRSVLMLTFILFPGVRAIFA